MKVVNELINKELEALREDKHFRFLTAASSGNIDEVALLFQEITERSIKEEALRSAAKGGYDNVVEFLVVNGVDVHTMRDFPVKWAARNGHLSTVRVLCKKLGANYTIDDEEPLRWAADHGHTGVVNELLVYGADITAANNWVLRCAARLGNEQMVRLALLVGADPNAENNYAVRHAIEHGFVGIAELIIQAGAEIQDPSHIYDISDVAVKRKNLKAIEMLMHNGVSCKDMIASAQHVGCPEMLDYILSIKVNHDLLSKNLGKITNNRVAKKAKNISGMRL